MWSCGVVLYILLCGSPPWDTGAIPNPSDPRSWRVPFPPATWGDISQPAKDLISSMLTLDPALRPTAEAALGATWFQSPPPPGAKPPLSMQRALSRGMLETSITDMSEMSDASLGPDDDCSEVDQDRDCTELGLSQRPSLLTSGFSEEGLSTVYSDEADEAAQVQWGGEQLAEARLSQHHSEALRKYTAKRSRVRGDSTASAYRAATRLRGRSTAASESGRASLPPFLGGLRGVSSGLERESGGTEGTERLSRFEISLLTGARLSHQCYSSRQSLRCSQLEHSSLLERSSLLDRSSLVSLPEVGDCREAPPCMARRSAVAEIDLEDEVGL